MYIISARHGIFNTEAIPVISSDGVHIYAKVGTQNVPISSDITDMEKIISALKAGESYVVLGEERK